ncbi:armadillo repeat-containing protein 7-like [Epargyreus clarus]|uniref:armadillo repeat-containing protein 7-like n=1 Tax=Epargyreus clarus TaxID=520877 RepID=UPI003C2FCCB9
MFSTKAQLQKRTPQNGTDRENYLSLLVDEFINSSSFDAKSQVLANLANFAYDPINYVYIRDVGVLDIFIHVVKRETNPKLLQFACAGICNLCVDPLNVQYLLDNAAFPPLMTQLRCDHNDIVADVITIFIYLKSSGKDINLHTPEITQQMNVLKQSENKVIGNLASIFLNDVSLAN